LVLERQWWKKQAHFTTEIENVYTIFKYGFLFTYQKKRLFEKLLKKVLSKTALGQKL